MEWLGDWTYSTRLVLGGCTLLGAAGGFVGSFLLLRRQTLVADPIGHATLPGLVVAFMVQVARGGDGRHFGGLLLGATIASALAALSILALSRRPRLGQDAVFAIVLSVFYGAGIAAMGIAQQLSAGRFSGIHDFLEGRAALLVAQDVQLIAVIGVSCCLVLGVLRKELTVLGFDPTYARSQRFPTRLLDFIVLSATTLVLVVGVPAVGLVLVMALLIVPPAAARFWSADVGVLLVWASGFGALSGGAGAWLSARFDRLPTGPLIVLVSATLFLLSFFFGTRRGLLARRRGAWTVATS